MLSALLALALPVVKAFITPDEIWGNNCVRANRGIYCFGGLQIGPTISTKMYHLDISTSWDSSAPPWTDLSDSNSSTTVPAINSAFAGAATLSDHSNILVNGGSTAPDLTAVSSSTAQFDTRTNTWSVPVISDKSPKQSRYYHSLLSDGQGRIWMWGGRDTQQYYNTWAVMDTTTWSISYPDIPNAPGPRIQHTATMVPDGKIVIIGGLTYSRNVTDPLGGLTLNPVSMADLLLFDMATAKWTNLTAGGNVPAPRREHTSILSRDSSSIIVFGGGDPRYSNVNMNDVFVLNLTSLLWSSPSTSNEPPPPRKSHQAILVKDSMLIMFGNNGENSAYNDVHIMDTSNWSWKTKYDIDDDGPKDTESMGSSTGANSQRVSSLQEDLALKALFGSIILASGLSVIVLFCVIGNIVSYHRAKNRQQKSKTFDDAHPENFLQDIRELIRMGTLQSQLQSSMTPQKPDMEEDINSQKPNEPDSHL